MSDEVATTSGGITYRQVAHLVGYLQCAQCSRLTASTCLQYNNETDLPAIMELIDKDLSEPYSIFTYRYFLHQWPHLCYLAYPSDKDEACGVVVCKMDTHGDHMRGYLAMLVVDHNYRGKGIGKIGLPCSILTSAAVVFTSCLMDCSTMSVDTLQVRAFAQRLTMGYLLLLITCPCSVVTTSAVAMVW